MQLHKKAYGLLIGFFCFVAFNLSAQNQKLADSLAKLYYSGTTIANPLELLLTITEEETNVDTRLEFCNILIEEASKDSLLEYLHKGYLQKGNAFWIKGDNAEALNAYFTSLKLAEKMDSDKRKGMVLISIAGAYDAMDNADNANYYYYEGISILRKSKDSIWLSSALLNAGDFNFRIKEYDNALALFKESGELFEKLNHNIGIAYNKGNLGMVYAQQGKHVLAEQNINEAVTILEELEDYYPISVYLTYMADIYMNKQEHGKALDYAHRSLELALQYDLKEQIRDANLKLSEIYELLGNTRSSLGFYKNYIVYRDSIRNLETIQAMANMEVAKKQTEVNLLEQKRKNQRFLVYTTLLALLSIAIVAVGLHKRNRFIKATNKIIAREKERSDNLLLNILPEETALELKEKGKVQAKRFESVTVLFTDFKAFSAHSEHLTPEALVERVDFYFSKFDAIIEKYGLEKIKTIGDAYMCAGGLPEVSEDHALRMVHAAFEIINFTNKEREKSPKSNSHFEIRIGIHTGPVVAGVVGSKKFAYDIWGDTVNIAARMESNSEVGRINISENTYQLVKTYYDCECRGEIEVKNRGKLRMHYIHGLKEKSSKPLTRFT